MLYISTASNILYSASITIGHPAEIVTQVSGLVTTSNTPYPDRTRTAGSALILKSDNLIDDVSIPGEYVTGTLPTAPTNTKIIYPIDNKK
jgi:hypothetical protein